MHRPPVDRVGYRPVHRSSRPSTWAASSITRRDKASERPASPDVDDAFTSDPLVSTKEVLLSILILAIRSQGGKPSIILFTFLTRFAAVWNLVAITRTFLSR